MQRPLIILAALAATVALFAVRLMPATLADARLASTTKGGVRLIDADGTLWSGRGVLAAGATRIPVEWRIDAWPLVRRELHLHFVRGEGGAAGSPKGDVVIGRDSTALRDVEATVPAPFFTAAAGSGFASLAGGEVEINAALIEWTPPANRGEARLRWRRAWLAPPGTLEPIELGDMTAALSADGDRVAGPVSNAGGDLAVRGTVTLSAASGAQLSLVLTPRRADDGDLTRALSMLGRREGDGWRVEWRFPLR